MAIIGNNVDTLLSGLSDFWLRYFQDLGDLQTLYRGAEMVFGQNYLDLMNAVLNVSVIETPLFRKEFYKLITIREDQIIYLDNDGVSANLFTFTADEYLADVPQLQNKIYSPSASLEEATDYTCNNGQLQFLNDPTNPPAANFAATSVAVAVTGLVMDNTVSDWTVLGVQKGDTIYINPYTALSPSSALPPYTTALTIIKVTPSQLTIALSTPFPVFPVGAVPSGYSWMIQRTRADGSAATLGTETEFTGLLISTTSVNLNLVSFWAVDIQVDDQTLYNNFGYLMGQPQTSTEIYRAFIRGIMQLYIYGPAIERVESALQVTAGLQIIRNDGEILQSYDSGISQQGTDGTVGEGSFYSVSGAFTSEDAGGYLIITSAGDAVNITTFRITGVTDANTLTLSPYTAVIDVNATWTTSATDVQTVVTNLTTYTYPMFVPMRTDVIDPTQVGVLTFDAFETLTLGIVVSDYLSDPNWWYELTIPAQLAPSLPNAFDRLATAALFPNVIGPSSGWKIGSPGFYIGADEDGHTPGAEGGAAYHHSTAFFVMDKFLKVHLFGVVIDPTVSLTTLIVNNLAELLNDLKPAGSMAYVRPVTIFSDTISISDVLTAMGVVALSPENLAMNHNQFAIGSSWHIGDQWKYTDVLSSDGYLGNGAYTIGSGTGFIPVVIGGEDPSLINSSPDPFVTDRPLHVSAHS